MPSAGSASINLKEDLRLLVISREEAAPINRCAVAVELGDSLVGVGGVIHFGHVIREHHEVLVLNVGALNALV